MFHEENIVFKIKKKKKKNNSKYFNEKNVWSRTHEILDIKSFLTKMSTFLNKNLFPVI